MLFPLLFLACAPDERSPTAVVLLDPARRLIRISMSLRGTRPTVDELRHVLDEPDDLAAIVLGWNDADPAYAETLRDMHNEGLGLRYDAALLPADGLSDDVEMSRLQHDLFEAPLWTASFIMTSHEPYTSLITANWGAANDITAAVWSGFDGYDGDGAWKRTQFSDGRPAAGILADPVLWLVNRSAGTNFSRGRANFVTSRLICEDFLGSPVEVDPNIDLSDPEVVADAVQMEPSCTTCHDDLDPIAAFFPFNDYFVIQRTPFPWTTYDSDWVAQERWNWSIGVDPGWFGQPGTSLADLSASIVDDPRFATCTARRFQSWLLQTPIDELPEDDVEAWAEDLRGGGWDASRLFIAMALADGSAVDPEYGGRLLRARPGQLARLFADLGGVSWTTTSSTACCGAPSGSAPLGTLSLLQDAWMGYEVLAGGVDGPWSPVPNHAMTPTAVLAASRAAEYAASAAVDADFQAVDARLLGTANKGTSDEAVIRGVIVDLYLRLLGEVIDKASPEADLAWNTWAGAYARTSDPARAWKVLLTALFQDLRLWTY